MGSPPAGRRSHPCHRGWSWLSEGKPKGLELKYEHAMFASFHAVWSDSAILFHFTSLCSVSKFCQKIKAHARCFALGGPRMFPCNGSMPAQQVPRAPTRLKNSRNDPLRLLPAIRLRSARFAPAATATAAAPMFQAKKQ